jgi:hypothetical protein
MVKPREPFPQLRSGGDIYLSGHRDEYVAWFLADLHGQPVVVHGLLSALPPPRTADRLPWVPLVKGAPPGLID